MKNIKVAALLSGGLDSSYMAYLLKKDGYEVEGFYLKLHKDEEKHKKAIENVEKIGQFLDIKIHIIDMQKEFEESIFKYFVTSYKEGLTPNPCALCNPYIKFGLALEKALEFGCEKIATGHYAKIEDGFIVEAVDKSKDQSYFLFGISNEAKKRVIFPLGGLIKEKIKEKTLKKLPWLGSLETYKDSQDICFIAKDYIDTLRLHLNVDSPGIVKDRDGKEIGTHQGYMHYTIGKRRGFRIDGAHDPHYVLSTDPKNNTIVVGKRDELRAFDVNATNLSLPKDFQSGVYEVKVRYRSPKVEAFVELIGEEISAKLKEPVFGLASGQALVVYKKEKVVGGGWIK